MVRCIIGKKLKPDKRRTKVNMDFSKEQILAIRKRIAEEYLEEKTPAEITDILQKDKSDIEKAVEAFEVFMQELPYMEVIDIDDIGDNYE